MKKILILAQNETKAKLMVSSWQKKFKIRTEIFMDEVPCKRYLIQNKQEVFAIIMMDNMSISSQTIENEVRPGIHIYRENSKDGHESLENQGINFLRSVNVEEVDEASQRKFEGVSIFDFMILNVAPCDVYVRLGDDNFVKIINCDELYTAETVHKFKGRGVKNFFIKEEDMETYKKSMLYTLKEEFHASKTGNKLEACVASLDYINKSLVDLGLDENSIELATETIDQVYLQIGKHPGLHKKLNDFLTEDSYLAEHSLGTAVMSCALAKSLRLSNHTTLKKLVIASLFHDIALKDHDMSRIINTESMEYQGISDARKKDFSAHIYEAIDFLRQLPDLPPNVESIILEHHERPNGKGFPHGLDSFRITPLGCVFIISEEFIHHIFSEGLTEKNKNEALEKMSEQFCKGNFKAPMNELLKMFIKR